MAGSSKGAPRKAGKDTRKHKYEKIHSKVGEKKTKALLKHLKEQPADKQAKENQARLLAKYSDIKMGKLANRHHQNKKKNQSSFTTLIASLP